MTAVAVIVAGGQGTRIEGKLPKQFLNLGDRPILAHCVQRFESCETVDQIVLVVPEDYLGYCSQTIVDQYDFKKVKKIVCGGRERQDSVYLGLKACPRNTRVVAIHDGVRPFVSPRKISESIGRCEEKKAVILAVPAKDTVKRVEGGSVVTTLDRTKLWLVQTPQVFEYSFILDAYEKAIEDGFAGTDDAMLIERLGHQVTVVEGEYQNIKITTAEDLAMAERLIRKQHK
ncbi:MAG: 2-C-methyl-D-erythritol 4-phosphate cytidylyltransferase [Candidatus Zixiibacteriota bacterium]|nr:MAG: 2-C-methyl-D-erythritol 4-phosphate cytidylyltransferase [candidate division Zixibacteria bacterium]